MRLLSLVLLVGLMASTAHAQKWANFVTISPTTNLVTNTLCYSDGRDLACEGAAGLLVTSGTVTFSNISATNISVSTINCQSLLQRRRWIERSHYLWHHMIRSRIRE